MIPVMIVPILTRPELLWQMTATIDTPIGHLIIVDNGRCIPRGIAMESGARIERTNVISMPANLGVAGSWNLGIKATPFAPWWLIVNFDVTWPAGSLEKFAATANSDEVILSDCRPPWSAFAIGENVVRKVGLFDEGFHPAYFEDNDYARRCAAANVTIRPAPIPVEHANSSTLASGYADRNNATYASNAEFFAAGGGGWSLDRRRTNSWD